MNSPQWLATLERDGFVHIPRVFGLEDVDRLAALAMQSVDGFASSNDLIRTRDGTPVKLLYPLNKYQEFVDFLGRKEIREIVDALIPKSDSVLTWEDILIKVPSVGVGVAPHQDIGLDPVTSTVHSLGLSLHADADNPVFFLPGSHRLGPLTSNAVGALSKDCAGMFRPVPTEPGDVVIHNVHVLHYSEPNQSSNARAT